MSDHSHIEVLEDGVAAWNVWRKMNREIRADLSGANIKIRDLSGVDFSGADMRGVMLAGADLSGANLSGADLTRADLMETDLRGADLSNTVLEGANLMGADLSDAELTGAVLDGAILYRADLEGSECVSHYIWLNRLIDFADGLGCMEGEADQFVFDDIAGSTVESSFMSTRMSRLDIELADPVSARAVYEILGALNRLYGMVADHDLPGPIVRIGPSEGGMGE
jgi:uncharacterized protein YjbI with pentapeptide repeats